LARAARAFEIEMMALATEGLALVCEGDVPGGMPLLDEATAAAVGGEMDDPDAINTCRCALIDACKPVGDFDRAGQWCDLVSASCLAN
jgi:hypothetical protein